MFYPKLLLLCLFILNLGGWIQATAVRNGDCDKSGELLCRYRCGEKVMQPMCLDTACYCTNVGTGSCKVGGNNEGCKDVCQSLGKSSDGCFNNECLCKDDAPISPTP